MIMPGPLAGTSATACSRWVMSAKSPHSYPDQYGFGNGGGFFGAALKRAGYDGLIITGKAVDTSYLFIENEKVEIKSAKGLQGSTTDETMKRLKEEHGNNARIVCIGPAGENMIRFAIAMTDQGGALSNGMGAVMGSKNLKALVVKGDKKVFVAHQERLGQVNTRARFLRKGLNESVYMTDPMIEGIDKIKATPCYACPAGCSRSQFQHISGLVEIRKGCASTYFYTPWDQLYHGRATANPFLATSLCNRYGLCTAEVTNLIHWLYECFQKEIVTEAETQLPLAKIGSLEFITSLIEQIVNKKGFGELLAEGTRRASRALGGAAEDQALARITPSGYVNDSYGARVFLITSLFYATEPRNPIIQLHEVNFLLLKWALCHTTAGAMSPITTDDLRKIAKRVWGSEEAVDFSTYGGKAQAAYIIQNRQHAKEAMVACDRYFPILETDQTEDYLGDSSLVPQFFESVTGRKLSERNYLQLGDRSVNLQRAIMGREGRGGRNSDTLGDFNFSEPLESSEGVFGMFNPDLELPGSGDNIISRKGKTLDRKAFERMKDEYYRLRGWDDESGMPHKRKLKELGLDFLYKEIEKAGRITINK
jgi:aldehyde:ferredoxin oxidoreductase